MGYRTSDVYQLFLEKTVRQSNGEASTNLCIYECQFPGCQWYIAKEKCKDKHGHVSPSKLQRHLDSDHTNWKRHLHEISPEGQPKIGAFCQDTRPTKRIKTSETNPNTKELVSLFIDSRIPFNRIDCPSFRDFAQRAQGENPPSRRTLTRYLHEFAEEEHKAMKDELFNIDTLCLCSDIWSSLDKRNFILLLGTFIDGSWKLRTRVLDIRALETRHTSQAIMQCFQSIAKDVGISFESQVTGFVTDSGRDIVKAVEDLNVHVLQMKCLAHVLNNGISRALKYSSTEEEVPDGEPTSVDETVEAIRTLVIWTRSRSNMLLLLKEAQSDNGKPQKKPMVDGGVRWYSSCDMVERYLEMRTDYIDACALAYSRRTFNRRELDWLHKLVNHTINIDVAKQLSNILKTLRFYGRLLEKDEPGSLSTSILALYQLANHHLVESEDEKPSIRQFKKTCREYLGEAVDPQRVAIAAGSCYVDPRFVCPEKAWKNEIPPNMLEDTKAWIKRCRPYVQQIIKSFWRDQAEKSKLPDSLQHLRFDSSNEQSAVDSSDDEPLTFEGELIAERRKFKAIAKESDDPPLEFWKKHCETLPLLAGAAKMFLAIPASSAPAERVFSVTGQFNTPQANRTAEDTLRDILILKNSWHGWLDLGQRLPESPFEKTDRGFDIDTLVEDQIADEPEESADVVHIE